MQSNWTTDIAEEGWIWDPVSNWVICAVALADTELEDGADEQEQREKDKRAYLISRHILLISDIDLSAVILLPFSSLLDDIDFLILQLLFLDQMMWELVFPLR